VVFWALTQVVTTSTLKMEAVCSPQTLPTTYKNTRALLTVSNLTLFTVWRMKWKHSIFNGLYCILLSYFLSVVQCPIISPSVMPFKLLSHANFPPPQLDCLHYVFVSRFTCYTLKQRAYARDGWAHTMPPSI
jgi:hypothetical protein